MNTVNDRLHRTAVRFLCVSLLVSVWGLVQGLTDDPHGRALGHVIVFGGLCASCMAQSVLNRLRPGLHTVFVGGTVLSFLLFAYQLAKAL